MPLMPDQCKMTPYYSNHDKWWQHKRRGRNRTFQKSSLFFILIIQVLVPIVNATTRAGGDLGHGLTTYGEACSDRCAQRGFPYTWCHKKPSRNGTWIDRDYCSASPGVTRYQEPCTTPCSKSPPSAPFYSCKTRPTVRGDWDYCSPFSADDCAWGQWGEWGSCSATCGSRSSRTRRRRMESGDGTVRHCSGEIEQSIRSCRMPECPKGRMKCQFKAYLHYVTSAHCWLG